jgi:hypothetical protein
MRLHCPCCGFFTVDSDDEVIVDICEVCFWQYDVIAHEQPERNIGANNISLNQARENYKKLGVCKKQFKHMVRKPVEEELPITN